LVGLTDPVGNTTQWLYDVVGRVRAEFNGKGDARRYDLDRAGNVVGAEDRNGRYVRFTYNKIDLLTPTLLLA
jgi:YD repeat-containing protein